MIGERKDKVFRLGRYVRAFEKSLNYMLGAVLAVFVAGVKYIIPEDGQQISLDDVIGILQKIHDDPRKLFCVLTAVLSTLPYYVYYTLKEDSVWNACDGKRDHLGLKKIYIVYEIGIMSFFYLLFQGIKDYAGSKMVAAIISMVLVGCYFRLIKREGKRKERDHGGYLLLAILLAFLFFLMLFGNSLYNLVLNFENQNISEVLLIILFAVNSGINIYFLSGSHSAKESGIVSNRMKIMIPLISISIFTASVAYCFLQFREKWWVMLTVALWITAYEILISFFKWQDEREKIIWCVVLFVIFMLGIPVMIWENDFLPSEFVVDWFILIGIAIYCAAIKYWGYILKILFKSEEKEKSQDKLMDVMIWFRNSILGSMILIVAVLRPNTRSSVLLVAILFCSLASELFIAKFAFGGIPGNKRFIYILGRIMEFFVIILPIGIYVVESIYNINLWELKTLQACSDLNIEWPRYTEITLAVMAIIAAFGYILEKWRGSAPVKLSDFRGKTLVGELFKTLDNFGSSSKQILPDKNAISFWTIVITWSVYIILAAVYLCFFPVVSNYRVSETMLIILVAAFDWWFLSKQLLNYYIGQMEGGMGIVKFQKVFKKEWTKCLETLGEFKETDAEQFNVGDRLRPILFFFGSSFRRYKKLNDTDYEVIAKTACSLELIHKASIIFDDYVDGDKLRKGAPTFHEQYKDEKVLFLLGNAMLARAQSNFADCKEYFKCSETVTIENMKKLSEVVVNLSTGCYKELARADYERQTLGEIKEIIYSETVSLIQMSLGLGYSCFHEDQGTEEYKMLETLGVSLGYIFQYLNDLEPFSQKKLYTKNKGRESNFDFGKKNIAMLILYQEITDDEKNIFNEHNYKEIVKLYQNYDIENEILDEVTEEVRKAADLLAKLKTGNLKWVNAVKTMFNLVLAKKGWKGKIPHL